ncbi:MAG: terminase [Deltaproteobacteria bacterium]|nr:MAG: terminase [Deltaproteobacteria bacterium]
MRSSRAIPGLPIDASWRCLPHLFAEHLGRGKWRLYPYLRLIGDRVTEAIFRGRGRLIVNLPPRHGKSQLVSVYIPAWYLSLFPERWVLLATYEGNFALSWGRKVRDLLEAHPELGVKIRQDVSAASHWETTEGGGMATAGFGGPLTGKGGHLLIVDDPVKNWREAQSPVIRKAVIEWFNSVFYTRAEPGATIVVVMTRWHERDLTGYLVGEHSDRWEVIRLPALAEGGDPLGRKEGEALCPERYPREELLSIKEAIGSYFWTGLYQQRPAPEEGGIFRREWWRYYREPPRVDLLALSWDTAFKKGEETSYTVCEVWGRARGGYYLLDLWRARVEYPELRRQMMALYEKWRPHAVLIEDRASGQSILQELRREGRIPVVPIAPEADKVMRARIVSPLVEAGKVHLPERAPWLADFLDEVTAFPNSEHDDQVDAMSQALDWLREDRGPGILLL